VGSGGDIRAEALGVDARAMAMDERENWVLVGTSRLVRLNFSFIPDRTVDVGSGATCVALSDDTIWVTTAAGLQAVPRTAGVRAQVVVPPPADSPPVLVKPPCEKEALVRAAVAGGGVGQDTIDAPGTSVEYKCFGDFARVSISIGGDGAYGYLDRRNGQWTSYGVGSDVDSSMIPPDVLAELG
jgi:hypothetical protein